ncbi:MAG: DUF2703 domain-containing protein [Halanaerobiales bacterium]|nr:DUF2703 domain-containing protein [Halanaerobiales bacterium]
MDKLNIRWQRLIFEGDTCPRCGGTEQELDNAIATLRQSLSPLGIEIELEKQKISVEKFKQDPLKSNMIYIEDKPLEKWIGGEVGQSQCCDVCGPTDCRTIKVDGNRYERIPSELIVKAGLKATSNLLGRQENSCCDNNSSCS